MAAVGIDRLVQFTEADGGQLAVGTEPVSLATTPDMTVGGVNLVYLQADPGNADGEYVLLGGSARQYAALGPGEWFPGPLPVSALAAVYAKGTAADLKLNLFAMK